MKPSRRQFSWALPAVLEVVRHALFLSLELHSLLSPFICTSSLVSAELAVSEALSWVTQLGLRVCP